MTWGMTIYRFDHLGQVIGQLAGRVVTHPVRIIPAEPRTMIYDFKVTGKAPDGRIFFDILSGKFFLR
jgi:hypothetical protein